MKYKIGFALSGGGAKGFAHAGAIAALEEAGVVPDIVSGTSAGAIFGALYGAGHSPRAICELFSSRDFTDFAKLHVPKASLVDNSRLRKFFKDHLGEGTFESLRFPLRIVTSDIDNGCMRVYSEGDLIEPLLASCCVPIMFEPIVINGFHHVDGGVFCNFPVSVIRDECDTVYGVNVSPMEKSEYRSSLLYIVERTYHLMSKANILGERELCDVLLELDDSVLNTGLFELKNIDPMFQKGYELSKNVLREKLLIEP